jgi:hypothetical protein
MVLNPYLTNVVGDTLLNYFKVSLLQTYFLNHQFSNTLAYTKGPGFVGERPTIVPIQVDNHTLNKINVFSKVTNQGSITNQSGLDVLKSHTYLPLLSLQNKVRTSFLKKNLITTLFTLQLSQNINSPLFFKLCSAKLVPIFFNYHITYIFKKFKRYGVFFGGPTKLMEFVIISFLTIISKDLNYFNV